MTLTHDLTFYYIEQVDSLLSSILSVIDHRLMTPKCGKNLSDTLGYCLLHHFLFLFLLHMDIISDLLLTRCTPGPHLVLLVFD